MDDLNLTTAMTGARSINPEESRLVNDGVSLGVGASTVPASSNVFCGHFIFENKEGRRIMEIKRDRVVIYGNLDIVDNEGEELKSNGMNDVDDVIDDLREIVNGGML